MSMPVLEQEDAFKQSNVDVAKLVPVFAIGCRPRVCAIGFEADPTVLHQGNDYLLKHLVEANRVLVEMFWVVVAVHANVRQIQPIIGRDCSDTPTASAQLFRETCSNETFPARIDPADADEHGAIRRDHVPLL